MSFGESAIATWLSRIARYLVGPVACFILVGTMTVNLGPSLRASQNQGVAGSFVLNEPTCTKPRPSCEKKGTFTSTDGRLVVYGTAIYAGSAEPGRSLPAQYVDSQRVFPPSSNAWIYVIGWGVPWAMVVLAWLWLAFIRPIRRHSTTFYQVAVPAFVGATLSVIALNGTPLV